MQNFGRGMWRRVGDFERIQVPQIIKHSQLEQAILYQEYMKNLQRQKNIQEYRKQILEKVNAQKDHLDYIQLNEEQITVDSIQTNEEQLKLESIDIPEETPNAEIIALEIPIHRPGEKKPDFFPKKGHKKH